MYTNSELAFQKESMDFDDFQKNLTLQFYIIKLYELLTKSHEESIGFKISVKINDKYDNKDALSSFYHYSSRETIAIVNSDEWNDYSNKLFDDILSHQLSDHKTKEYFFENPILNVDNFSKLVDFQKQECGLNPEFNYLIPESGQTEHYIEICDLILPGLIKSKEDLLSFNEELLREKIKYNNNENFYILMKNIIKEVNKGSEISFVRDDEKNKHISDILINKEKSFDFGKLNMDKYYFLTIFFNNMDNVNKKNINKFITDVSANMDGKHLVEAILGKENANKTIINIEKFILNISYDDISAINVKNKKRI